MKKRKREEGFFAFSLTVPVMAPTVSFFFPFLFSSFPLSVFFLNVSPRRSPLSNTFLPLGARKYPQRQREEARREILVTIALGKYFRVIFNHFTSSGGNSLEEKERESDKAADTDG